MAKVKGTRTPKTPGMTSPGNINLKRRPIVRNNDGSISTVRSMGIGTDRGETLIPTVSDRGRIMSDQEAIAEYSRTGRNLGSFSSIQSANSYAQALHTRQAGQYGTQVSKTKTGRTGKRK